MLAIIVKDKDDEGTSFLSILGGTAIAETAPLQSDWFWCSMYLMYSLILNLFSYF